MPLIFFAVIGGSLGLGWILDYLTDGNSTYNIFYYTADKILDISIGLFSYVDSDILTQYSIVEYLEVLPDSMLQIMYMSGFSTALSIIVSGLILRLTIKFISGILPFFK